MPEPSIPGLGSMPVGMPAMPASVAEAPDSARLEWLWSEYEKQMADLKQYQEEGMDIYPTPGLVLKTTLLTPPARATPQFPMLTPGQLSGGRLKFFVNLTSDPAVALPSMQPDASGDGEQLRVPMSAGPVTLDLEKDGATACLVADIVLNPASIDQATKDKEFREFIGGFALQKLEDKYKITVDQEGVKWPKMKFKTIAGFTQPAPQHIRRPKSAHVEEERPAAASAEQTVEERQKAAALARIEALREMEERESGIQMHGTANQATSSGNVFLTEEAAKAQADQASSPMDLLSSMQQQRKEQPAKIEVLSSEAAAPSPTPTTAAPAPSSSLPAHTITYLKSLSSDVGIAPSEWDMDLPEPPAAVRIVVQLPLATSASEVDVEVHSTGMTLASAAACSNAHGYQLHIVLPFVLVDAEAVCKYAKKTRTMTVTLPVASRRDLDAEEALEAERLAREAPPPPAPAVDWRDQLALTNTIMFRPVSTEE